MAKAYEIASFLDDLLKTSEIEDYSYNGLQVDSTGNVENIYGGVDATMEFFNKANFPRNSLYIVHHGIFWKNNDPRIINGNYSKINFLLSNNSSLYASHLPLDLNKTYGNNISLLEFLGVEKDSIIPFGLYHGISIGFRGEFKNQVTIENISKRLEPIAKNRVYTFPFGKQEIKTIGVVSGGGSFASSEAVKLNLDLFLTGETDHTLYTFASDAKLSVIFATHYATETFGVKNLGNLLSQNFNINFTFIDLEPIF